MNQAVSSSFVAFHVTAAAINNEATSPITLFSLPSNSRLVRVPTFVELYIDNVLTAYTIGSSYRTGSSEQEYYTSHPNNYADNFAGGRFLQITDGTNRVFFNVPLVGFFDQLTEQKRLAFPNVDLAVYQSGAASFKLRFTTTLSGGDGDLYGRLHYDEYALYA